MLQTIGTVRGKRDRVVLFLLNYNRRSNIWKKIRSNENNEGSEPGSNGTYWKDVSARVCFLIEGIPSREEHKKPVQCLPNIWMGFAWTNWHNLDSSIARGTYTGKLICILYCTGLYRTAGQWQIVFFCCLIRNHLFIVTVFRCSLDGNKIKDFKDIYFMNIYKIENNIYPCARI